MVLLKVGEEARGEGELDYPLLGEEVVVVVDEARIGDRGELSISISISEFHLDLDGAGVDILIPEVVEPLALIPIESEVRPVEVEEDIPGDELPEESQLVFAPLIQGIFLPLLS